MQMRIVDMTKDEFIEMKAADLTTHLYAVIEVLQGERQERLNYAQTLVRSVDDAMTLFAGYVADIPTTGTGMLFQSAMSQVAQLSKRIAKLQTYANSFTLTAVPSLVRINLDQAKEFSL